MIEGIVSAFNKFFSKERVLALILFLILIWALYSYSDSKSFLIDQMGDGSVAQSQSNDQKQEIGPQPDGAQSISGGGNYALKPIGDPSTLLPNDQNSQWAGLNPTSMNKGDVLMPDLLQAGYHIGLDTIGQTLRNPNLQLRSDPIISKMDIGPWSQSTMEPDLARTPLELGEHK